MAAAAAVRKARAKIPTQEQRQFFDAIRAKDISASELVRQAMIQIDELDPAIQAFNSTDSARALLSALNLALLAAVLLLGFAAPLLLRVRGGSVATAAMLALAGGFLLRTLIVFSPQGIGQ